MRKILITIPTLNSGGVEVSLVRFINELSRDKNNKITLLMLKREGLYLDSIPDSVEIIEVSYDDRMYSYNNKFSDIKNIKGIRKSGGGGLRFWLHGGCRGGRPSRGVRW